MTETTQPGTQVVARVAVPAGMTLEWDRSVALMLKRGEAIMESRSNPDGSAMVTIRAVAAKPLSRADIPAGQGPASLFLAPDGHGDFDLCFKYADGHIGTADIELGTLSPTLIGAFRDHLAATLPTVTDDEETP